MTIAPNNSFITLTNLAPFGMKFSVIWISSSNRLSLSLVKLKLGINVDSRTTIANSYALKKYPGCLKFNNEW